MAEETPNPGSEAAQEGGCLCPVFDNNHGRHKPWPGDWFVRTDCPMHGHKETTDEA